MKEIEPTPWFELATYAPVRAGWYEVQLEGGATAFAKYGDGNWTEQPSSAITHWRGLSADPAAAADGAAATGDAAPGKAASSDAASSDAAAAGAATAGAAAAGGESIDAEATAAEGVRAAWNAFFPALGEEQHKPLDAAANGKAPH